MCGENYFAHKILYTINSINKVAKGGKKTYVSPGSVEFILEKESFWSEDLVFAKYNQVFMTLCSSSGSSVHGQLRLVLEKLFMFLYLYSSFKHITLNNVYIDLVDLPARRISDNLWRGWLSCHEPILSVAIMGIFYS